MPHRNQIFDVEISTRLFESHRETSVKPWHHRVRSYSTIVTGARRGVSKVCDGIDVNTNTILRLSDMEAWQHLPSQLGILYLATA